MHSVRTDRLDRRFVGRSLLDVDESVHVVTWYNKTHSVILSQQHLLQHQQLAKLRHRSPSADSQPPNSYYLNSLDVFVGGGLVAACANCLKVPANWRRPPLMKGIHVDHYQTVAFKPLSCEVSDSIPWRYQIWCSLFTCQHYHPAVSSTMLHVWKTTADLQDTKRCYRTFQTVSRQTSDGTDASPSQSTQTTPAHYTAPKCYLFCWRQADVPLRQTVSRSLDFSDLAADDRRSAVRPVATSYTLLIWSSTLSLQRLQTLNWLCDRPQLLNCS